MIISTRALACAVAWAILVSPAFGADPPNFGVEVGTSLTTVGLSGPDATGVDTGAKAGLLIGAYVSMPITPTVAIQPEVIYAQRRFKVSSAREFSATEKWDFVEIPVLARIGFQPPGNRDVHIVAGPEFSFTTRANETRRVLNGQPQSNEDIHSQIQSADVRMVAGIGIKVGHWGVDGRYEAGLVNLNKDRKLGNLTIKERAVSILALWSFK